MKLNIGCGNTKLAGYKGVDIDPNVGADYCCSAWELPLGDSVVEEVYARHFLEHMTPAMARKALNEWKRVLKPTGSIRLVFPNLEYHCKQLLDPWRDMKSPFVGASNFEHAMAGLYGWINTSDPNPFMEHKWGYTKESFRVFAKELGFTAKFVDCRECDIDVIINPDS